MGAGASRRSMLRRSRPNGATPWHHATRSDDAQKVQQFRRVIEAGETSPPDAVLSPAPLDTVIDRPSKGVLAMIESLVSGKSSEVEWELESMTMRGTLVRPPGDGPFPGVVFVAGSGP